MLTNFVLEKILLLMGKPNICNDPMSRWQSIGFPSMEENKANGISWQVGSLTMNYIAKMLFG